MVCSDARHWSKRFVSFGKKLIFEFLRNLDLADNSITQLPPNIGDLTRLNELSLCDNKVSTIPSSIGQMKYLESLKMSRNCLDNLTPAICSCYELRDLSLSDNKLTVSLIFGDICWFFKFRSFLQVLEIWRSFGSLTQATICWPSYHQRFVFSGLF